MTSVKSKMQVAMVLAVTVIVYAAIEIVGRVFGGQRSITNPLLTHRGVGKDLKSFTYEVHTAAQSGIRPARKSISQGEKGAPMKGKEIIKLNENKPQKRSPLNRTIPLDFDVRQEAVINGVEMGVLDNGIPYLTQSGLAIVCGVQRLRIKEITDEWAESYESGVFKKGKMTFIGSYLLKEGFVEPKLFIPIIKNGTENHAYPDVVCMAILEYYAFESKQAVIDNRLLKECILIEEGRFMSSAEFPFNFDVERMQCRVNDDFISIPDDISSIEEMDEWLREAVAR